MTLPRFVVATSLLLAVPALAGCQRATPKKKMIGQHVTRLNVYVGGDGGGYSVDVAPDEYVVVEHQSCPNAKNAGPPKFAEGLCVVRITKEQSDRFIAAMERFKRNAIPFETYSLDDPYVRPDGKPCKGEWTDSTIISLLWTGTESVKIATFYAGCDPEEFGDFYKSALAVTDALPIQAIIKKR